MSMKSIPPHTPLLYSKTGLYRGIPIFLIFFQNIDSTASVLSVPTIYVLSKNVENIKNFQMKFSIFNAEKILCILHGQDFMGKFS